MVGMIFDTRQPFPSRSPLSTPTSTQLIRRSRHHLLALIAVLYAAEYRRPPLQLAVDRIGVQVAGDSEMTIILFSLSFRSL